MIFGFTSTAVDCLKRDSSLFFCYRFNSVNDKNEEIILQQQKQ